MNKLTLAMILAASAVSTANAGASLWDPVRIQNDNFTRSVVIGSVYDSRFLGGPNDFILCTLSATTRTVNARTSDNWVACAARDSTGYFYGCTLVNPPQSVIDAIAGINANSTIQYWGNRNGECLAINIHNGSGY